MKILITGASGFIGSNLVERLLQEGNEVIGIDKDVSKKNFLKDVIESKNFKIIWDNINNLEKYSKVLKDIDEVYHLAASANIRASATDTTTDMENNVLGTHSVLELMRRNDTDKLIFASSSAVYGVRKDTPTRENAPDLRPISLYSASKLANEAFINAYSDLFGIKAWMFRFAQVIGRHEHRGVIIDFIKKLKEDDKVLKILGDGKQEKSYFDVSDCVNGFIEIPKRDGNKSVEIYNLGNTEVVTVSRLAEILCDEIGVDPKFEYTGGDRGWLGDTPYCILSIEKSLRVGWVPKYDCEESIRRAVRYINDLK